MVHDGILADERAFGMLPLLMGTLLITLVSLLIAIPLGILSAIYMVEYASHKQRSLIKPLLEALAGIPTIVYGFFAIMIVSPLLNTTGELFNLHISSESALAAGLVMGIMIIPFISSLADDAMRSVPSRIRDGALALGSTRYEVIRYVIIPASSSSLISAFLLATSRAIGETMIVVMAAGLSANMTANPFEAVTTITVQIVKLLTGDQSFHSPKTLVAFALGTLLFCITLLFNLIAIRTAKKYHKKYD
jgi:phosphate transport system permease protein